MATFYKLGSVSHGARRVREKPGFLVGRHCSETPSGLRVIIVVIVAEIPSISVAEYRSCGNSIFWLLCPGSVRVGFIGSLGAVVAVNAHLPVAGISRHGAARAVDWNLVMVDSKPIPLGVSVSEQPCLQHFVRRKTYSWNNIGGIKCRLFDILEIIFRISVQFHNPDFFQRKFIGIPFLGKIEWIVRHLFSLFLRHHLDA